MASALNQPHTLTVHEAGELDGLRSGHRIRRRRTMEDWSRAEHRSRRQIIDLSWA